MQELENIKKGIEAYKHEQNVLLRLIRFKKGLYADDFDRLFVGREYRKPVKLHSMSGDSFILGMGINGGDVWSFNLELLQYMMQVDLVNTKRVAGRLVYVLN